MATSAYHLLELQIASDPADVRRVMPAIGREHRRILDVGCGAGQTLLASALGGDVTAIGIDSDPEALKLGRRLGDGVRFVCARGESLPLPGDHFDLVISRVIEALSESLRTLQLRHALHKLYVLANGALAHVTGRELPSPFNRRYESFQTQARVVRHLRSLGFENIVVRDRVFFVVTATKPRPRGAAA